jgi:tight adherence protein B
MNPFHGTIGLVLVTGLFFGTAFVVLMMVLGAGARAKEDRQLAKRMMASAAMGDPQAKEEVEKGAMTWMPGALVEAGERVAAAGGLTSGLEAKLERAGSAWKPGEVVAATAGSALLGALIGLFIFGNVLFGLIFAAFAGVVPYALLGWKAKKRADALHAQLPDALMTLASSLRAGHSFFQALDLVAREIGDPGGTEFARVVSEIRLGRPVEDAMNAMAERVGSEDFKWSVLAVNIQREVGGNLSEILETVADTLRERDEIRRQVDVLSAEGKLSMWILTGLPVLVALFMAKLNPGYLNPLFTTRVGLIMVVTATAMLSLGVMWMRKVVKIDV